VSTLRDVRGEILTAGSRQVVERYDHAVEGYLGARADTRQRIAGVLAEDHDFAFAHCMDGYLHMLTSTREGMRRAAASLARARAAASRRAPTTREARHIEALDAWARGGMNDAAARWGAILDDHPRDLVAVKVSQFVLSYLGESERMRELVAGVVANWEPGVPGYGYLLGCYAYGLEEAGDYRTAEEMGRTAVELNPTDIWAAHAVAHVAEMQGRVHEGLSWIAAAGDQWSNCNSFARHLRWHEALYHLDLDRHDLVLALYDRDVRSESSDEYLDMANAASLLWRLEQAGVETGDRWNELADRARRHVDDHALVFVDLHYLMALAAVGDSTAVESFLASCERFVAARRGSEAAVMAAVGLPLAHAVCAHRQGRYNEVVATLAPVRHEIRRIGGSHAQRDVFEQLLIDAAWRGQHYALAAELLAERTAGRPRNLWAWKHYAAVLDAMHASEAAEAARTLERLRKE
jgi:tetratricopeptide (TPR) repeat protein